MKIPAILLATVALAQQDNNSYELVYNSYEPAAATYQAPADSYEPPADSYEPPAANYQAPADNYQAPAYGNNYKTPLKCWHCNAVSIEECASKGQEETCLVSFEKQIIISLLRWCIFVTNIRRQHC